MAEQDSAEKTEKATPHKVREARGKGMVAKSQDINSLLLMAAGLLLMYAIGEALMLETFRLCRELLADAGRPDFHIPAIAGWSNDIFSKGTHILGAYVGPLIVVAVLATWLQTGPVLSFFPLKPDASKLNPVTGFKRIFSVRLLVELVKSLLKIVLFGSITYFTFVQMLPGFMGLSQRPPGVYVVFFIENGTVLIFRILLALVFIALIDLIFNRWDHQKKLRMSKKELKDEFKRFEGDPQIRQKRKEIARELLERSRSLGNISGADVVITNPTRYAVAVKYDRQTMPAPKVMGKGTGALAARIRELAGNCGVPVVQNPPLARRLYRTTRVDGYIGQDEYLDVAGILRKIYADTGRTV